MTWHGSGDGSSRRLETDYVDSKGMRWHVHWLAGYVTWTWRGPPGVAWTISNSKQMERVNMVGAGFKGG